jgi:hypothetical protein
LLIRIGNRQQLENKPRTNYGKELKAYWMEGAV